MMHNRDAKVIALAQNIAKLMHKAGDRSDALDAHDMARTFYRRIKNPSRPESAEPLQPKKRVLLRSA
jgi:hypothetical protein